MRNPRRRPPDAKDRQILDELARDAWQSYLQLAERVHLSASAVQRRVERLVADRIVLGASARIASEATGRPLHLFVLVELRDESQGTIAGLKSEFARHKIVSEAFYVAGRADIVLVIRASDMAEFSRFAASHLNANPRVRRYQSMAVLSRIV